MPGRHLADAAWPVGEGTVAQLTAVTGSWVTVTGKRREREGLITSHDASPARATVPLHLLERTDRMQNSAFA